MKSGIGRGWGSSGSSQSIQTVHRLLQAVPLAQVVVNLAVLHSRIWGLAPCGNLPHCHSEGPLWGGVRGERIRGSLLHKDTPQHTGSWVYPQLYAHVYIAIFVGAWQLFTEPFWHRYTLRGNFCTHSDTLAHAHIYTWSYVSPCTPCPHVPC